MWTVLCMRPGNYLQAPWSETNKSKIFAFQASNWQSAWWTRRECIKQQVWETSYALQKSIAAAERGRQTERMPECSSPSFDEFNFSAPSANAFGALQASQTTCALGVAGVSHAEWSDRADKCLAFSGELCSSTRLISHSCPSRATSLGPLFTSHNCLPSLVVLPVWHKQIPQQILLREAGSTHCCGCQLTWLHPVT